MKNDGLQWKSFYLWKINSKKKKKKIDRKIPLYRFKLNSTKQWIAINYLSIANRSMFLFVTPFFKIIPRGTTESGDKRVSWPIFAKWKIAIRNLALGTVGPVALIWRIFQPPPSPLCNFPRPGKLSI